MDQAGVTGASRHAFARRALFVAALIVLALLFWMWRQVLLLAFGSVLIAIGLHGVADPLARRTPLNKGWSLAVAGLGVLGALAGIFWMFGAQFGEQLAELQTRLPSAWRSLEPQLAQNPLGAEILERVRAWDGGGAGGMVSGAVSRLSGWTLSLASATLDLLVVISAAVFLAADPSPYRKGALYLIPPGLRGEFDAAFDNIGRALRRWLTGTLISMLSVALMTGVAIWLLGVPAFVPLALIAGLSQFVPLIGPILAVAPAALLALTVSPETALWTIIAFTAAAQIDANIIYPMVQKRAVSLPPALTLFAIIAMGLLFGPLGVLFAVPLAVVITIFVARLYLNRMLGENVTPPGAD